MFLLLLAEKVQLKLEIHRSGAEFEHLKRRRRYVTDAYGEREIHIGPNPRYLQGVLQMLSLENCRPVETPLVAGGGAKTAAENEDQGLQPAEATLFRSS